MDGSPVCFFGKVESANFRFQSQRSGLVGAVLGGEARGEEVGPQQRRRGVEELLRGRGRARGDG